MTETNLVTKDTVGNFNMMSKVMGISTEGDNSDSKTSTLARVKIIHAPIMGIKTIDGEETETVVVKAGSYSVQMPDDKIIYAPKLSIRPFMQRFMYKRYVQSTDTDTPSLKEMDRLFVFMIRPPAYSKY